MMKPSSITDLHECIVLNILYFLPAKFIIRCRCVCKDWANLICQPYFPLAYLSSGRTPLQLVLEKDDDIVLAQLDESLVTDNFSTPIKSIFDLNIRRFFSRRSSNHLKIYTCQITGWILAVVYPYSTESMYNPYFMESMYNPYFMESMYNPYSMHDAHMYNPITGQHIVVQSNMDHKDWQNCALIFAQKTNQLKLLIFHRKTTYVEAAIQTIGTNLWRDIGEVYNCQGMPIFLNGKGHWLNDMSKVIISFDAEEEVFQVIHTPLCFQNYEWFSLGSLDGCLCVTLIASGLELELWVMKQYGIRDSWTKSYVFSVSERPKCDDWKKDSTKFLESLTCLNSGELLMLLGRTMHIKNNREKYSTMIGFNPHSRKYRYVGSAMLNKFYP